jgi:uncharacterized protein YbjT (DUF2867 family)
LIDKNDLRPVLVLGATGMQGGAVVKALIARGIPVRALVRDAHKAASLADSGVMLANGTFEDKTSLVAACNGVRAVFSMQNAPTQNQNSERLAGRNIVTAAREANVPQFIHTSVSGAGAFHRQMKGWGTGRWNENYWESKADVEDAVRSAGFRFYTIIKPAFMMENFTLPKAKFMFPDLVNDEIITAFNPKTKLVLVSVEDIGLAAAAAVVDPERFNGAEIELAGDAKTIEEIAAIFSHATGRNISSTSMSPAEIIARGQFPGWVNSQEWSNEVPYPATPAEALAFGLKPVDLAAWAESHSSLLANLV